MLEAPEGVLHADCLIPGWAMGTGATCFDSAFQKLLPDGMGGIFQSTLGSAGDRYGIVLLAQRGAGCESEQHFDQPRGSHEVARDERVRGFVSFQSAIITEH